MEANEPIKTFNGQTIRDATVPITLHISASLGTDNTSYDLANVEADLPITLEPSRSADGRTTIIPKVDSKSLTKRLTSGINAFLDAFNA